ncbi:hypothetical protein C8F04DRAFT_1188934 [Mycena alexandri]|uniref:Uncharacterized protein n=1 Tax=Mycena alexandri TaxID=1745969 RepID=A0AAD6SJI2_9AGAR|nr:hypothetical protein C8F04DRAFT_1188934 [Mycena alexandri]
MSSPLEAHYDRSLLAQTPPATRAQLQEGYDAVLLAPNRRAKRTQSDLGLNEAFEEPKGAAPVQTQSPTQSFWQRRWKSIVGLLIVLVVIAAVVGGAVGATSHKKKSNTDSVGISTVSASDESGIFGLSTSTSTSQTEAASFSADSVAVATQPVASADIFSQVTARHFFTA